MKGKGILDRKGTDKTVRKQERKRATGRDPFNHSMDRFGPTKKVSKKRVHLMRWSSFPGRTVWNFGLMDRAHFLLFFCLT